MKGFEKFLFFYGIIAITVFFISFGIFSPRPLNFISGVLMLPIVFYFWVKITNPENLSPGKWSARFITVVVLVSLLGIFGFYLSSIVLPQITKLKSDLDTAQALNTKTKSDLDSKNAELAKLEEESASPSVDVKGTDTADLSIADLVVGTQSAAPVSQRIMVVGSLQSADVYQNPDSKSAKIGALLSGISYPYITKQNGWYKIVLSGTKTGWVSPSQVQEQ